jgi:hypothetical protein
LNITELFAWRDLSYFRSPQHAYAIFIPLSIKDGVALRE